MLRRGVHAEVRVALVPRRLVQSLEGRRLSPSLLSHNIFVSTYTSARVPLRQAWTGPHTPKSQCEIQGVRGFDPSCLERLSKRLIERQIVLLAHTIRLDEQDPLKRISVDETGGRVRSYFRRTGRPRTKWYDTTRNPTIKELIEEGHLLRNVREINTKQELNEFVIQMAQDRHT